MVSKLFLVPWATVIASPITLYDSTRKQTGDATYYGSYIRSKPVAGNCGFSNVDHLPAFKNADRYVAINFRQYGENSRSCGMCLKFRGTGTGDGLTRMSSEWTSAIVVDRCAKCQKGDLDIGIDGDGWWGIEWYATPCDVGAHGYIQYVFEGSNPWYLKLQPLNSLVPVEDVALCENERFEKCRGLRQTGDGHFVAIGSRWHHPFSTTLHFKLTSIFGEALMETVTFSDFDTPKMGTKQFSQSSQRHTLTQGAVKSGGFLAPRPPKEFNDFPLVESTERENGDPSTTRPMDSTSTVSTTPPVRVVHTTSSSNDDVPFPDVGSRNDAFELPPDRPGTMDPPTRPGAETVTPNLPHTATTTKKPMLGAHLPSTPHPPQQPGVDLPSQPQATTTTTHPAVIENAESQAPDMAALYDMAAAQSGEAMYYGDYIRSTPGAGQCSFDGVNMLPAFQNVSYVAMNNDQYGPDARACGMCLKYRKKGDGDTEEWKNAIVVDRCPECAKGDLDIGEDGSGHTDIEWYATPCNVGDEGLIQYSLSGSDSWYLKVQARNTLVPVEQFEFCETPTFDKCHALNRTKDGHFIATDVGWMLPFSSTVHMKLTSVFGEEIAETLTFSDFKTPQTGTKQFLRSFRRPRARKVLGSSAKDENDDRGSDSGGSGSSGSGGSGGNDDGGSDSGDGGDGEVDDEEVNTNADGKSGASLVYSSWILLLLF